jgi:hypothetical protein
VFNKTSEIRQNFAFLTVPLNLINLILTVSNPYKYHSFSFIFHLASSLALKGGDSTERGTVPLKKNKFLKTQENVLSVL